MPDIIKSIKIICISAILAVFLIPAGYAANADYAALPPFISADVKPNVVLVMDYSGSMQLPANYTTPDRVYYTDANVYNAADEGDAATTYDSSDTYYGYFDSDAYYKYTDPSVGKGYWEVDETTTYSGTDVGDKDSLSGNFLNFLVMTRVDVALKALIGGKAECPSGEDYCTLRPQGARRWIEVSNLNADCYVRPETYWEGDYASKDILISIEDQDGTSDIGTFDNRYARVRIGADDRQGVVQENADKVRFSLIVYATASNSTAMEGLIKHGVHEQDISNLVDAMETTVPYQGTHSGEALREAYYYLKQDSNAASYNSDYIDPVSATDPYYEQKDDGTVEPAWCRRSFAVLISDGVWGGIDPDTWAHNLHTDDLRETDSGGSDDQFPGDQHADVYSLFTFSQDDISGIRSMKTVAAFGNYKDIDDTACEDSEPYGLDEDDSSKEVAFPLDTCDPSGTYNDCCEEWDADGDGVPDAFYNAYDGEQMVTGLTKIFSEIRQGTSSGTAVTALTSRATSGAAITQAVFYPEKEFEDEKSVTWTGNIFSEWYLNAYIDGNIVQNIREDTNNNFILDVESDMIIEYVTENNTLRIDGYESGSDGMKEDEQVDDVEYGIENVNNLFDTGEKLKDRSPDDRKIYGAGDDGTENGFLQEFTTTNSGLFADFLGSAAGEYPDCLLDSSGNPQYNKLISYVRGEDVSECRSRAVDASGSVWKLGDIISSSPTAVNYGDYRMIYTGSNDGMLHAFRMGKLKNRDDQMHPTQLCEDDSVTCSTDDLGKEEWAFIPKDAMPYLRYMASPTYEHIYAVDLKPYIVSLEDRTILIGGMRFGGAPGIAGADVNPPADTAPVGRSAYFALDITDPLNPEYLWRFAPEGMGFTYSGPAHVMRRDATDNVEHFLIFASGPTGYDGTSVQALNVYVVDPETGSLLHTHNDPNFNAAFGGRLFNNGLDMDKDGQTDYVFMGFTNKADQTPDNYDKMTGGIYKIYTGSTDPSTWDYDVFMSNNIGNPITAPVKIANCFPEIIPYPYLYFGSGRYFVPNDQTQANSNDLNHLYGVPIPCDANNDCATGSISNITNSSDWTCQDIKDSDFKGAIWKIPLEPAQGNYLRERLYSDFTVTNQNIVFYDTAMPTEAVCECGGQSRSWALNCATGMGLNYEICDDGSYMIDPNLSFQFLVQLSGGDIKQSNREDFGQPSGATSQAGGLPGPGGTPVFPAGMFDLDYWKQW